MGSHLLVGLVAVLAMPVETFGAGVPLLREGPDRIKVFALAI